MKIIIIGFSILLFTLAGVATLDPDFGWHIKAGRLILQSGVQKTDPFSYTMPSYPFVDHEWLTNILMAKSNDIFGYNFTALAFGLLGGFSVFIFLYKKNPFLVSLPLLIGFGVLWSRSGIRPQLIDWFFLSLLLRINWHTSTWNKFKWFIPPIFLLWANLHGGFALGPVILGFIIFSNSIQKKSFLFSDFIILIASTLLTLLNPYGFKLWHEVRMQMTDPNLRKYIAEWQPFYSRPELGFWLLLALDFSLITRFKKELEYWKIGLFVVLTLAGLSSLRHMPLVVIFSIYLISDLSEKIYLKDCKDFISKKRAQKFLLLLYGIGFLVFVAEVGIGVWKNLTKSPILYPTQAVNYLKNASFQGQVFSNYGWGGFLILNYPEKKVFIDGRMPSFRWRAPVGESDWAFLDYREIVDHNNYRWYFSKYDIDVVLWPKNGIIEKSPSFFENFIKQFSWFKDPVVKKTFIQTLEQDGWSKKYEDNVSIIYFAPGTVK